MPVTLPAAVYLHSAPNAEHQLHAARLNPREHKAIEDIVGAGVSRHANIPDRAVAVKKLDVTRISKNVVFVVIEVGYVGDETSALGLFRTRGTFLVGSRGGIKVCYAAGEKRRKGDPLIFGWER